MTKNQETKCEKCGMSRNKIDEWTRKELLAIKEKTLAFLKWKLEQQKTWVFKEYSEIIYVDKFKENIIKELEDDKWWLTNLNKKFEDKDYL